MTQNAKARLAAIDACFSALAHPVRRQILMVLHARGDQMAAGAIAARFSCAWPTVTRHLSVLLEAGLIEQEKDGRSRNYRLNKDKVALAKDWLAWFSVNPL